MKPMPSRHRRLTAAVAVAALSTSASVSTAVAHASADGSHSVAARTAPTWIKLSAGGGVSTTTQPRVARWGHKLLVTWQQQTAADYDAINSRVLGANGKPAGPTANVATWYSATTDPQPLILGGVPTVVFGGLRTDDITDPYSGTMAYAQAADATSWGLGAGSLTQSTSAYGDYGFGVVDDGTGQPITAGAYSSSDHVTVHYGIDSTAPATAPDQVTGSTGDAGEVNLARDPRTGAAWALWYSGVQDDSQQGIRAAQVWPAIGPVLPPAPLSTVTVDGAKNSVNPSQDVSVTGRIGGGVWAAYASGWPLPHKLVLWHVGTSTTLTLKTTGDIQYTGISPAPGGRLWVWWVQDQTLFAVRTNPSVTKFGVVRAVRSPATAGQAPTRTGGDGTFGPLDAVINVIGKDKNASGDPTAEIFSTRIPEALKVTVSPAKVSYARGGQVVVKVSDAGLPVPGVTVRVGSLVARTNARGVAAFVIEAKSAKGRHVVAATAAGWYPGSASFRVG
ncbi:MAG: hypothetical protein QOD91_1379 [Frankiales bacterium]|nr:hypothetical protein [Frankiales bacterium]